MKEERGPAQRISPLGLTALVARGADRVLTALLVLLLALLLFYACYALWDTWRIYNAAGIDENLLQYKPKATGEDGDGFAELLAINPDVCGWLTLEDTNIDYPVVQGTDNVTYVNTDVYGAFSLSGSIFLDCRNSRSFEDSYSLLYGHHMDGGVMFGELASFAGTAYFETHTAGWLYLPDRTLSIEFFACLQTDAYDPQLFQPGDLPMAEREALLERIQQTALQYRDIGVTAQDQILALSTCSDTATNGRTVLLGRFVEDLEAKGGEGGK